MLNGTAASAPEIKQLLDAPDNFSPRPVTVFTYEGGRIREAFCDVPGWPNVTHEGLLMYENLYSTCKKTVVRWALRHATCSVEVIEQRVADLEKELFLLKERHSRCLAEKKKLENDYPDIET